MPQIDSAQNATLPENICVLDPVLNVSRGTRFTLGKLYGSAKALAITEIAKRHRSLTVVVAEDMNVALRLEAEIRFFLGESSNASLLSLPDWETLPYDVFSPHQDIISQRLETLFFLPRVTQGILIVPVSTMMQRICPPDFLNAHSFILKKGDVLDLEKTRAQFTASGYHAVPQVMEHGEFAVRGNLLDLFPMGSANPIRIDLFDNEVESLRTFDVENQRTLKKIDEIRLLPAREFPFSEQAIAQFRQAFRETFEGDPQKSTVYRDVSQEIIPPGIEYYLPLFFNKTSTLFDYLPKTALLVCDNGVFEAADKWWTSVNDRYEQRRHNIEHPLLPPDRLFLDRSALEQFVVEQSCVVTQTFEVDTVLGGSQNQRNCATARPFDVKLTPGFDASTYSLTNVIKEFPGRILLAAESEGRREVLLQLLRDHSINIVPKVYSNWHAFLEGSEKVGMCVAPIEQGLLLDRPAIALITEAQLFGHRVQQQRKRRTSQREADAIIHNLTELNVGSPVVHQDHGVGRYLGLQSLNVGGIDNEFLALEYAGGDKLYVPVSSLHLISRYTGGADSAPLHRLGSDQWEKAKRKAAEKARDVAAELLDIYARREASKGHAIHVNKDEYSQFAASFAFEETPDQQGAIDSILHDLQIDKPMDRLVCGDVGFGKTEVAMRAAFVAAADHRQVAVLVPTTLLANQHYQNFLDRFANWPFRIEVLSRFRSKKEQDTALTAVAEGRVDIIIGTHKLIQEGVKFKNLGLLIVDEEHRFGVQQKEKIKSLCANVHLLSLTATPIPRTLNLALSGLRDLSIIATPPTHRMAVKTFVTQWNDETVKEACQREIKRGGQVYFLHNDVDTIEKMTADLAKLIPDATAAYAHGQMRERDLEQVMLDFYHRRFNLLVCTTIVESGIDIPTANTIIINRADRFGLAQLHQLRGRVGRSHHRAYAYLMVPPRNLLTADAQKRLEAIESLEDLGAGFLLASHDLEIRGAGEFLGQEQSGQIHEIGYSMYMELLERAVKALKAGKQPELDRPLDHGAEIGLHVPALIPDEYLPDIQSRLTLYKRIASAPDHDALRDLQVEMIDRFGLLPQPLKNLVRLTELKLLANPLGIRKIDLNPQGGRIIFNDKANVDPMKIIALIQKQSKIYKLEGQSKLRITKPLPNPDDRFDFVDQLLKSLR